MMRTSLLLTILLAAAPASAVAAEVAPASPDTGPGIEALLSFTNGDQLHGHYLGFTADRRLLWEREDLAAAPEFSLSNIRRIILRNGRPEAAVPTSAHADTIHGDRIPGEIIALDDENLMIATTFAGTLAIPRDRLESLAPNPYGGRVFYQGPFAGDEWEFLEPVTRTSGQSGADDGDAEEDDTESSGWQHSGAAWYWTGKGSPTAMIRRDGIPDSTVMRYQVSWKSRISLAFAFHADFQRPLVSDEDEGNVRQQPRRFHPGDTGVYADFFGNSYVLQLNPTHAMMFRTSVDDEGNTSVDRMQTSFNNVRLGDSGTALVEIRASRTTGDISLFINDEYVAQWSEIGHLHDDAMSQPYAGKGNGFGFFMQTLEGVARVSEVTIAEWNGMPDAARSMQIDDHDIVLLSNGTDRFSGKVNGIADGRLAFTGRYGDFDFPIAEVAEIRFARASIAKADDASQDRVRLHLHPHGIITGVPVSGNASHMRLDHPSCGPIDVELSTTVIIDMNEGHSFLDAWDPDF